MAAPEGAQLSDDGMYWWDGSQWQLVNDGEDASSSADAVGSADDGSDSTGQLSEDGQYRWDGSQWQPVDEASAQEYDDSQGGASFDPGEFTELFSLVEVQSEDQVETYFASLGIEIPADDDEAMA